jgi:protein translocase SecG subunit
MKILPIIQIFIIIFLIITILFQQRGQALGSAFGGEGGFYATRRGLQQKFFIASIILGILFIAFAFLNLLF